MTTPKDRTPDHSFDEFDEANDPRDAATAFEDLANRRLSRRRFLGAGAAAGLTAFVTGTTALTRPAAAAARFGFRAVAANRRDTVTVPKGYSWHVVTRWGDPLWRDGAIFDPVTRGTGASQERAFGDNNDGMALYTRNGRHILAVNNEFANRGGLYGNRKSGHPETADDVRKGKAAHGVSVVEIVEKGNRWSIITDSPFNRRITADTPMAISGPARGHDLLKTAADPAGTTALGTWNNCGAGRTPWGTYLSCEENFNGYFSASGDGFNPTPAMRRYGIGRKDWGYAWAAADERFDISKHPHEPNRAGYVVEIDPLDPASVPKKLTALGRFKHENAVVVLAGNGQVAVYMGDDERGEFLYKFVSDGRYTAGGDNASLLQRGKLFAAKFHDDGRGEWRELTPAATGMASQAEVCIHTRMAASAVKATTMDRPEWVAANPNGNEVYCTLTNNTSRGRKTNRGGDAMPVGGANPRRDNRYGHIVRWMPANGDHTATAFTWDLFVLAGNPTVHDDARKGSANVNAANMFNSPDGLAFDSRGLMWIQTDGNTSDKGDFAGMGNNQMLIADPLSGEIRRFMVGPRECEVTGLTWSADRKTVFVGIQHPGNRGGGHFPDGGGSLPRSSVIAISRDDGGLVG